MQTKSKKIISEGRIKKEKTHLNTNNSTHSQINFNDNIINIIEKLRRGFNPGYDISLQVLKAKEIEKHLNKLFNNFMFSVSEVDSETSKRLITKFADPKYWNYSKDENNSTILKDILSCGTLICKDNENTEPKKKSKVTLKAKTKNRIFSNDKEYIFDMKLRAVKINIKSKDNRNLIERNIFTIPGIKIDDELSRNKLYKRMTIGSKIKSLPEYKSIDFAKDGFYKALDFNLILSFCKLIDESFDYIDKDTSFLYKTENTYYNKLYSVEDMYNLLNVSFLGEKESIIPDKTAMLIIESAIATTNNHVSATLSNNYEKELKTFFKTINNQKENKLPKYRAIEKNNRFLNYFDSVEIDNNIDIEKFYRIENEFIELNKAFTVKNSLTKKANLIFKNIEHRDLEFVYNPGKKNIYVDIENPSAFCIGIGHYLDYVLGDKNPLSMEPEFKTLAFEYRNYLEDTANSEEIDVQQVNAYKSKRHIYHTPTEIWAKCFELYLVISNNIKGNVLHTKEYMTICNGYPKINDKLLNRIINYFSNIIDVTPGIDTSITTISGLSIINVSANNNEIIDTEDNIAVEEVAATSIELSHDGDGTNYFFRIMEEALCSSNNTIKIKKRRRRKVVNEDNATQVTFF